MVVVPEQDSAFDAFAEEQVGCFGEQLVRFTFSFGKQFVVPGRDRSGLPGRQLVGADEVSKLFRVEFADGGIFVVTVCLAGDDLPVAVSPEPRVGGRSLRLRSRHLSGFAGSRS